jgi:hypothetical protein
VIDRPIDLAGYRASLGPIAERIEHSHSVSHAFALADAFLRDSIPLLGGSTHDPFRNEVAYLWSVFPARVKTLGKYQEMLKVLLGQVVDARWYGLYPRYESDRDVERDASLITFTRSKEDFQVGFEYVQYFGHVAMRIPNSLRLRYRRATNHPGRYTHGLTTTRCPRAMAALVNYIADTVTKRIRPDDPVRILVNSVLRTVAYQHSLATWGYVAPRSSAHVAGYAVDIEKGWYERHDARVDRALAEAIADLADNNDIYAVDERTHWHVCLDPARIPRFEALYANWAG